MQFTEFSEEETAITFNCGLASVKRPEGGKRTDVVGLRQRQEPKHSCQRSQMRQLQRLYLPSRWMFEYGASAFRVRYGFIGGHKNMKLNFHMPRRSGIMEKFEFLDNVSGVLFSIERYNTKVWCPSLEFSDPIHDCGIWHNDK